MVWGWGLHGQQVGALGALALPQPPTLLKYATSLKQKSELPSPPPLGGGGGGGSDSFRGVLFMLCSGRVAPPIADYGAASGSVSFAP